MGKTEDDFNWTEKPIVLKMTKKIIDACYEFLKPKRKPRSIDELYLIFVFKGYLRFKEKDLFEALTKDERFIIDNGDSPFF
ncbi:MAG: hypothetical protein U9P79_01480, partial [Candidatus Cloacimonadota bacterium]|nr:hypothetical protein [Candidatus Cloacimonadota bacterium]